MLGTEDILFRLPETQQCSLKLPLMFMMLMDIEMMMMMITIIMINMVVVMIMINLKVGLRIALCVNLQFIITYCFLLSILHIFMNNMPLLCRVVASARVRPVAVCNKPLKTHACSIYMY